MYVDIQALHNTLESKNINHVFQKRYYGGTDLHSAVITFPEGIEPFEGHTLKQNLPVGFMQIDGGKLHIYKTGSSLEMEVTPAQAITIINYFKESEGI